MGWSGTSIQERLIQMSELEQVLEWHIKAANLPAPEREYRFCDDRRWRADFAWPGHGLLVEVEGGQWIQGRHTRGKGFENDCEKYNRAELDGWMVLRFTAFMISSGKALTQIIEALSMGGDVEPEPVYILDDEQVLRCTVCGVEIGREERRGGKVLLKVGDVFLYSFHGWHDCKMGGTYQVHWDSQDVIMRRLVRRRNAGGK